MARILVGSWMVRYPLGGNLSWNLQWLVGLQRLGHEVYLVERAHYRNACFDPSTGAMGDDATWGMRCTRELLQRFGLEDRWCFVDVESRYFGLPESRISELFRGADLFLDLGAHGAWNEAAAAVPVRVVVDGEPAFTQIRMLTRPEVARRMEAYTHFYSNGACLGEEGCSAPLAGKTWRHVFNPVVTDLHPFGAPPSGSAFTTVMNWRSHEPIVWNGRPYGQKDVEFRKFIDLPSRVGVSLEVAAAGPIPGKELTEAGWRILRAHAVTTSYDGFLDYVRGSAGEFSVCKNVFVETASGWFSDRSAVYLASGRPVVMQETGFSRHLPCGSGLYAVHSVEEAAEALQEISAAPAVHSHRAREIAREHLDASRVLPGFLAEVGL
jgi:hypothetical protein